MLMVLLKWSYRIVLGVVDLFVVLQNFVGFCSFYRAL